MIIPSMITRCSADGVIHFLHEGSEEKEYAVPARYWHPSVYLTMPNPGDLADAVYQDGQLTSLDQSKTFFYGLVSNLTELEQDVFGKWSGKPGTPSKAAFEKANHAMREFLRAHLYHKLPWKPPYATYTLEGEVELLWFLPGKKFSVFVSETVTEYLWWRGKRGKQGGAMGTFEGQEVLRQFAQWIQP